MREMAPLFVTQSLSSVSQLVSRGVVVIADVFPINHVLPLSSATRDSGFFPDP